MKTTEVWVLAKWQIPEDMWAEEGERVMSLLSYDVSFALGSLCSLDSGPEALKTKVDGVDQDMSPEEPTEEPPEEEAERLYASPEEYKEKTGKRFRMTKDQKDRALTREQAFDEFAANL